VRVNTGERLVLAALSFYGEDEGKKNSRVLSWIKKFFRASATDARAVPWCGIFMAQVFGSCGIPIPSAPARAVSWATVGSPVFADEDFQIGDILIFDRKGGNHVALFISKSNDLFYVLGGNQGNKVGINPYDCAALKHARRIRLSSVDSTS